MSEQLTPLQKAVLDFEREWTAQLINPKQNTQKSAWIRSKLNISLVHYQHILHSLIGYEPAMRYAPEVMNRISRSAKDGTSAP